MTPNRMRLVLPAYADNVGVARVAVAAFASQLDFTVAEIEELKVAVSEAVTNAVIHAYRGREPGEVVVLAECDEQGLRVTVADTGVGIEDVERAREAAYTTSDDPDHLGLGFTFMETFSDRVEVTSAPGRGTRVVLYKTPREVRARAVPEPGP
ncbi:MAG: anti-sigma F factor [Clostridia bacterium]|nr:anti-sigma F factor [Clostridia bacterium]